MSTQRPGESKASIRRIELAERRARALELRKAGATYDQIAQQAGYSSRANAYRDVMKAIKDITAEPAADVKTLELARLDAMLMGTWRPAITGNQGAIDRVIRIMDRRAKLLGLDAPVKTELDTSGITVVFDDALRFPPASGDETTDAPGE